MGFTMFGGMSKDLLVIRALEHKHKQDKDTTKNYAQQQLADSTTKYKILFVKIPSYIIIVLPWQQ